MSNEFSSIVTALSEDYTNNLHHKLEATRIPISIKTNSEGNDLSVTIFVVSKNNNNKKSAKHNKKSFKPSIDISFSDVPEYDIEKAKPVLPIEFIWNILEFKYYQMVLCKIRSWSSTFFRAIQLFCDEKSMDLDLKFFSFEVFIGKDCSNIHVSTLPSFADLRFCDSKNPKNIITGKDFLDSQAHGIVEASKAYEEYQSHLKNQEK